MPPINLYFDDPYRTEFESAVLTVDGDKVELTDSWFFPQGGGQLGDTGSINGIPVVNTLMENGRIVHILEKGAAFVPGDRVSCLIDKDKRYRRMRLHSASHIVFYFMKEIFGEGCGIASSGLLDEEKERSDYLFDAPLDKAKLKEVEDKVNSFISGGHEIKAYRDPANPENLLWELGRWKMSCCGTHPHNTKEIGQIRIGRGKKPGKGRERIEITLA